MSEIADKVKKIVVEHLGVEEAFSVEIPEDAAEKITTVKDAIDYIEKQKAA